MTRPHVPAARARTSPKPLVAQRRRWFAKVLSAAVILGAVIGLLANIGGARDFVCSLSIAEHYCSVWGWTPSAEHEREDLVRQIAGKWGTLDCRRVGSYSVIGDRIVSHWTGFSSVGQITGTGNGAIYTTVLSPQSDRGVTVEYHIEGERLVVQQRNRAQAVELTRCR